MGTIQITHSPFVGAAALSALVVSPACPLFGLDLRSSDAGSVVVEGAGSAALGCALGAPAGLVFVFDLVVTFVTSKAVKAPDEASAGNSTSAVRRIPTRIPVWEFSVAPAGTRAGVFAGSTSIAEAGTSSG